LAQEVRLLAPSDLKGLYIGWGQILIREHFDWLFDEPDRVLLIDEFDAIARSRGSSQMHSDEKADVNELLVQLDKASHLGRMVLCTTNYVSSLDEAVLRSGRFAEFVPVPPPSPKEAMEIVIYYLDRLGKDSEGKSIEHISVHIPEKHDVEELIGGEFAKGKDAEGRLCGADLEAAVNAAFRKKARAATETMVPDIEEPDVVVDITREDLGSALAGARHSIGADAIERFLADVKSHSPGHIYDECRRNLFGQ
jgi:SpoVK/Ycf46/Vps4 family AAA+-type ATPase